MAYKFTILPMKALRKITYVFNQMSKPPSNYHQPQKKPIKLIDKATFQEASLLAFTRFKKAFQKLADNNKDRQIRVQLRGPHYLQVKYQEGSIVLKAQSDTSTMFFTSPGDNASKYYYDTEQKRFYSNTDGHLLDENLARQTQEYIGDVLLL